MIDHIQQQRKTTTDHSTDLKLQETVHIQYNYYRQQKQSPVLESCIRPHYNQAHEWMNNEQNKQAHGLLMIGAHNQNHI
jgi:hypothetical protein